MERDIPRLRDRLERDQKRYVESVDKALLGSWLRRALALPAGQRIASIGGAFGAAKGAAAPVRATRLDRL